MTASRRLAGTVVDFDEAVGLGTIEAEAEPGAPAARYPFHCTQLADGSRLVSPGTAVRFRLLAGRGGRSEATDIRTDPRPG